MWPFSSSPTSTPSQTTQSTFSSPPPSQSPQSPPPPPERVLTRDELADRELQSFLQELESSAAPPPPSKKYTRTPRLPVLAPSPASNSITSPSSQANLQTAPEATSIAESLLPTSMSCRTAFDAAFYCNSFGGRFNDLYRYGTLRSCSDTWNDFWFCMKTKGYSSPSKENAIRDHYREKERRKYGGVSAEGEVVEGEGVGGTGYTGRGSEDIWRSRETMVEKGSVFREVVTGWEKGGGDGGDKEWNEREREKRRVDGERYAKNT